MKRVAIIGADFAPSSMPPALRLRFFASHLPEFGWKPTVITTDPTFYECATDPDNERLLPEDLDVLRTSAIPAPLARKVGLGDVGMRSLVPHWRALARLCRRRAIDLVFVPVPPYVPMVLGRLAHMRFGVPYVIDYSDPWVIEDYWRVPKADRPPKWPLAYALSRTLEPFALKRVAQLVGVSNGTGEHVLSRYSHLRDVRFTEIPFGGEASDFEFVRHNHRPQPIFDPNDGMLHLSYVGACIPAMLPTVRAIFDGLKLGLQRAPKLFERVRLHFVGTSYAPGAAARPQVLPLAHEIGVESFVDERPNRVSYLDAIRVMVDSHAILLVGFDAPHYTASKVFSCILARRPLFAIFHEASTVVPILRETGAGSMVTFGPDRPVSSCAEDVSRELERLVRLPAGFEPPTHWEMFEFYTTRTMTKRLAQVFDEVVSARVAEQCS